jgi:hypothetical protein
MTSHLSGHGRGAGQEAIKMPEPARRLENAQLAPAIIAGRLLFVFHDTAKWQPSPPPPHDNTLSLFSSVKADFYRQLKDPTHRAELSHITTIDDVYRATNRLQEDQAKRGTLRNLRRIDTYLQRLGEFSEVLGLFVQVKPDILALIWGPIKLLIHLSSNFVKSLDAILDVMSLVGEKLPVIKDYAKLYAENQRVNDVLALIFRDVLEFHLAALKILR